MTDPARGPTTEELRARVLAAEATARRAEPWRCERCGWTNLGYVPTCDGCASPRPPLDSEGAERP